MESRDFTSLEVWKKAHTLMIDIYALTKKFPGDEKYNLVSQLRRSVSSIAANIAEGYGRFYFKDNISFCRKARGSLDETRNHLMQAYSLKYISKEENEENLRKCEIVRKLLNGYIAHLKKRDHTSTL